MGAGSTMNTYTYLSTTSSHTLPLQTLSLTTFNALCKGRNNNLIQCKQQQQQQHNTQFNTLHCETTTMLHELRDSSRKRKRNRNIRSQFNMKPLYDLTNEDDNALQTSGKELLNTNDHTTGGIGGCVVHGSNDIGKEINIVNGDEFSICSGRTPLHKDTCDTGFIIRHNIIQSSPNLKSVYDLFLTSQVMFKKKQMSCQLKKRPMILNIHKYCAKVLNGNKDKDSKINDALALNISIDHVPQCQYNNNSGDNSNSGDSGVIIHQQHINNIHHHHQSPRLHIHTKTQTQFSSNNYTSSISNALLFNYNNINNNNNNNSNNTINSSINNTSNTTLTSNLKSIQHELSTQITTLYRFAKSHDSISNLTEIFPSIVIYQSKLYSTFKDLTQSNTHILYSSYLNKMLTQMNCKFPSSSSQVKYSPKYCIVTKHEFAYYTSKEKLIMLGKPILSIPLKHITKVSTITTNNKIHLLLFFKSNNNITLKNSSFENKYKKEESYFLFTGSERALTTTTAATGVDSKNIIMDKEICKWFLILNYLLLLSTTTK